MSASPLRRKPVPHLGDNAFDLPPKPAAPPAAPVSTDTVGPVAAIASSPGPAPTTPALAPTPAPRKLHTTFTVPPEILDGLDEAARAIRRGPTRKHLTRSEVASGILTAVLRAGLDVSGAGSEAEVAALVEQQLRR